MGTFTMRLDEETHNKLQHIALKQSRSQNKQVDFIVKQYISEYERINGKIELDDTNEEKTDFRTRATQAKKR